MSNDVLFAQYPKQVCVRDRNYSSLLRWSRGTLAMQIPTDKPDEEFVRNRIVAARLPDQIDSYVQRTLSYFVQNPLVTGNVYPWLSAFNSPDIEDQLTNGNASIIAEFMPQFALTDVSDEQVQQWYVDNGFA